MAPHAPHVPPTVVALCAPGAALLLAGCGGGAATTGPDGGAPVVSSVTVSPEQGSAGALDATVTFSATARDGDGEAMSDVAVSWSSGDPSLATVSSGGVATALAEGTVEVVAQAAGRADTAILVIDQVVDSVAVSPSSLTLQGAGDTARLNAAAADANGHPVGDASIAWSSSDPSVATVDGDGLVTARADGQVRISAAAEGVTGAAPVGVGAPPRGAPTIASVSPSPLREGSPATISGSAFDPDAAGDTVLVDGVPATVTAATSTSLDVVVPQYECLPARDVPVEVRTSTGSNRLTHALDPDEAPVALAPGEQRLVEDPAGFCLQFPETSSSERYLLGVQSLSGTPGSLTPVTVTSEAAGGGGSASGSPVSLAVEAAGDGGGDAPRASHRLRRHRQSELRRRAWERRHLDPGASLPAAGGTGGALAPSLMVSGGVQVGDTVSLRVPDLSSGRLCAGYAEVGAEVKAVGTRGILVADTANPSGGFTDADYRDFSDRMDTEIFGTLVDYFGSPTDLDGNGRVVVLISREVNAADPGVLGFVFSGDLYARGTCASSDEGEIYYGKAPDPDGDAGPVYPTDDARSQTPFVMSHELTHVIQQSRRFAAGDSMMSSVVAEAQATFGEEVVGHAVTGRTTGQDYGATVAFNAAGTDEIDWYADGFFDLVRYFGFESSSSRVPDAPEACGWWREDPSPCRSRALWYGVGWTFLRWASDHFGPGYPGGEQGLHRDLIDSGGTGPGNVAAVLGEPAEELMAQWAASLYVDGRIAGPDPRLTLPSWDLFDVERNTVPTAHLEPAEQGFSDWQGTAEVRASSTGYIALEAAGRPAASVRVRGGSGGPLPADMQVWLVRLE